MKLSAADLGANLEAIIESDRSAKKREDLIIHGSEYRNLCFVRDGYAIRYRLLRSGKRQILNVILPGDVIGFPVSFLDRSAYSVVALMEPPSTCPADAYVRVMQPQFALGVQPALLLSDTNRFSRQARRPTRSRTFPAARQSLSPPCHPS